MFSSLTHKSDLGRLLSSRTLQTRTTVLPETLQRCGPATAQSLQDGQRQEAFGQSIIFNSDPNAQREMKILLRNTHIYCEEDKS